MPSTPRNSSSKNPKPEAPVFSPEALDQLFEGHRTPEAFFGTNGLFDQLSKALLERALPGEMTHHLGHQKHDPASHNSGNSRNGTSPKTIKVKRAQVQIEVPRDRQSQFEPQLIAKGQTRLDGFTSACFRFMRADCRFARFKPTSKRFTALRSCMLDMGVSVAHVKLRF